MFRQIVLSTFLALTAASGANAQDFEKGWVDIDFGLAKAAEKEFASARVLIIAQEAGGGAAAYSVPRGASFDVGGGYMFNRRVGLGVSLSGTAHEDSAGLAISVPHPLYFNASATDATVTNGKLTRSEGAWHLHAMLVAAETGRIRVRVFGGPSYFRAEQEIVSGIAYDQRFQIFGFGNVVDITSYTTEKSVGTGWGFHGGGDLAVFFNRVFGLGAVARVSRGTVEIEDYGPAHDIKTGGVQVGGGLRLKF